MCDYVPTQDTTFYAKWDYFYEITYDANGGCFWSDTSNTQYKVQCVTGKSLQDYFIPSPNNMDVHLQFAGWYLDADGTVPVEDINNFVPDGNQIFYAKWEKGYAITLDGNGKPFDWEGNIIKTYGIKKGSDLGSEPVMVNGTCGEFIFSGWYFEPECVNPVENLQSYIPTQDTTLYAKWDYSYKITFDANGGYFELDTSNTQYKLRCVAGKSLQDYFIPNLNNEDVHLQFAGWYFDADGTVPVDDIYNFVPDGSQIIYAKWVIAVTQSLTEIDANVLEQDVQEKEVKESIAPENDSKQVDESIESATMLSVEIFSESELSSEPESVVESVEESSEVLENTSEQMVE